MRNTSARRSTLKRGRVITNLTMAENPDIPIVPTVPTGEKEVPCPACDLMMPKGVRMFWFHIGTDKTCPAYDRTALSWLKR